MSQLKEKLLQILNEKITKIKPENIKKGLQIFDVIGTMQDDSATQDANLESKYLLTGYSMVSHGVLIIGTMPNNGTKTFRYNNNEQIIPVGYYDSLSIQAAIPSELDGYIECKEILNGLGGNI